MPTADLAARLRALTALPGVAEAVEEARDACTRLRFDETLRRRTAEAAAESRVRGAWASAALDGAELPIERVRDLVRGAEPWGTNPVDLVARGAIQATAESERVAEFVLDAPGQALARLHVAATAGLLPPDQVGRPRTGAERSLDLVDLGPALPPAEVADRLGAFVPLLGTLAATGVSALVVGALLHGEVATARPFVLGNGVVARALERAVIQASGLDPTGVAVPETGHRAGGLAAYVGALTAYAAGTPDGIALWLRHCADAVAAGAAEGERVCAAVRAGRLG